MGNLLSEQQLAYGAVFEQDSLVPTSYGNDAAAYTAVTTGVAVSDRSHWGRLRVSGADRLRFLHNQTTNQLQLLQPGRGCDTAFVTSTARILDLASLYVQEDSVLLLVSPGQASRLSQWMDRYIFFADKVDITDETTTTVALTLLGPDSIDVLAQLGVTELSDITNGSHRLVSIQGIETCVVGGSGLAVPGYTLIAPADTGAALWQALVSRAAVPLGERVWQQLRIEQGRPMPGAELTDDYNPLEAGLWQAVSFDKGCYIGQETIARLNTYQGVKQQLWGLRLQTLVETPTPITLAGEKIGTLTSCIETPTGLCGLGYIRTRAGGAGLTVEIHDTTAVVVDIPFATRGYLTA